MEPESEYSEDCIKIVRSKLDLLDDVFQNIDLENEYIDYYQIIWAGRRLIPKRDSTSDFYYVYVYFLSYPDQSFGEYLSNLIKFTESYCGLDFWSIYFPNMGHHINFDYGWSKKEIKIRDLIHHENGDSRYKNTFSLQGMQLKFIGDKESDKSKS